jgi:hypothetical protein
MRRQVLPQNPPAQEGCHHRAENLGAGILDRAAYLSRLVSPTLSSSLHRALILSSYLRALRWGSQGWEAGDTGALEACVDFILSQIHVIEETMAREKKRAEGGIANTGLPRQIRCSSHQSACDTTFCTRRAVCGEVGFWGLGVKRCNMALIGAWWVHDHTKPNWALCKPNLVSAVQEMACCPRCCSSQVAGTRLKLLGTDLNLHPRVVLCSVWMSPLTRWDP